MYQNPTTPRFWVNVVEWLIKNNMSVPRTNEGVTIADPEGILNTLPVNPMPLNNDANTGWFSDLLGGDVIIDAPVGVFGNKTFIAVLGHNLASVEYQINDVPQIGEAGFFLFGNADPNNIGTWTNLYETSNDGNVNSNGYSASYDGFTIRTYDVSDLPYVGYHSQNTQNTSIGSMIIGTYYDMPHSCDLKITMSSEMDGVKRIRTKGGSDLVNRKYTGNPKWGELGAWELSKTLSGTITHTSDFGNGSVLFSTTTSNYHVGNTIIISGTESYDGSHVIINTGGGASPYFTINATWAGSSESGTWTIGGRAIDQSLSRIGRRVWDLSFSYLDDGDVFGSNQSLDQSDLLSIYNLANLDGYESGDLDGNNPQFNLLTDDNFYSQVIHKTNGGQLPFIFQPDNENFNPDSFAIAKIDPDFTFKQVSNGVYDVKMRVREVW